MLKQTRKKVISNLPMSDTTSGDMNPMLGCSWALPRRPKMPKSNSSAIFFNEAIIEARTSFGFIVYTMDVVVVSFPQASCWCDGGRLKAKSGLDLRDYFLAPPPPLPLKWDASIALPAWRCSVEVFVRRRRCCLILILLACVSTYVCGWCSWRKGVTWVTTIQGESHI